MSILIKGMEMPKYTTKAEFGIDANGNPLCMVYHDDGTEHDIYDVVSLPKGRLIDADAIFEQWNQLNFDRKISDGTLAYWNILLYNAPTIIETEENGI